MRWRVHSIAVALLRPFESVLEGCVEELLLNPLNISLWGLARLLSVLHAIEHLHELSGKECSRAWIMLS